MKLSWFWHLLGRCACCHKPGLGWIRNKFDVCEHCLKTQRAVEDGEVFRMSGQAFTNMLMREHERPPDCGA